MKVISLVGEFLTSRKRVSTLKLSILRFYFGYQPSVNKCIMRYAKLQLCPWAGILLRSHEGLPELQERRSKDPSLILHLQTLDSEVSTRVDWLLQ